MPFLNPVLRWDEARPADRSKWRTQHDGLRFEEEPRVYHVFVHKNETQRSEEFWDAVQRAASQPIQRCVQPATRSVNLTGPASRYVPADRTRAAVRAAVAQLLSEWEGDGPQA